nr:toprim domain-containing protein [Candidatus Njordarchaeum guaymaensis]
MKRMRHNNDAKIERISDVLTELSDYSSEGIPILVEGMKDEQALKDLGVEGRIIKTRTQGKKIFELAEELASYRRVIVLTDFDQEGEELAKEIARHLHMWGVQTIMRRKARNSISWATRQIEGLNRIKGLREKLNIKQFIVTSAESI